MASALWREDVEVGYLWRRASSGSILRTETGPDFPCGGGVWNPWLRANVLACDLELCFLLLMW